MCPKRTCCGSLLCKYTWSKLNWPLVSIEKTIFTCSNMFCTPCHFSGKKTSKMFWTAVRATFSLALWIRGTIWPLTCSYSEPALNRCRLPRKLISSAFIAQWRVSQNQLAAIRQYKSTGVYGYQRNFYFCFSLILRYITREHGRSNCVGYQRCNNLSANQWTLQHHCWCDCLVLTDVGALWLLLSGLSCSVFTITTPSSWENVGVN